MVCVQGKYLSHVSNPMKLTMVKNKYARAALWTTAGVIVSVGITFAQSNKKFEAPTWIYATSAVLLCPMAYWMGCHWNQNHLFPLKDSSKSGSIHTVSEGMVIAEENNT